MFLLNLPTCTCKMAPYVFFSLLIIIRIKYDSSTHYYETLLYYSSLSLPQEISPCFAYKK